ncbi:MAG: hypothetical protein QOG21_2523 [Actinomycetota bacterium]|jgi:hypothetical protein|nr:hypothetical protein [Actinomycetota bacterium]
MFKAFCRISTASVLRDAFYMESYSVVNLVQPLRHHSRARMSKSPACGATKITGRRTVDSSPSLEHGSNIPR